MQVKLSSGFVSLKGKAELNQAFNIIFGSGSLYHLGWEHADLLWSALTPISKCLCSPKVLGWHRSSAQVLGSSQPPLLLLPNWINLLLSASKMLTPHPNHFYSAWFLKFRKERVLTRFVIENCAIFPLYFKRITFSLWSFWLILLNQNQQWGLDY